MHTISNLWIVMHYYCDAIIELEFIGDDGTLDAIDIDDGSMRRKTDGGNQSALLIAV